MVQNLSVCLHLSEIFKSSQIEHIVTQCANRMRNNANDERSLIRTRAQVSELPLVGAYSVCRALESYSSSLSCAHDLTDRTLATLARCPPNSCETHLVCCFSIAAKSASWLLWRQTYETDQRQEHLCAHMLVRSHG